MMIPIAITYTPHTLLLLILSCYSDICSTGYKRQYWLEILFSWKSKWILLQISISPKFFHALFFNMFALEYFSPALWAFPHLFNQYKKFETTKTIRHLLLRLLPAHLFQSFLWILFHCLRNLTKQESSPICRVPQLMLVSPITPHGYYTITWLLLD